MKKLLYLFVTLMFSLLVSAPLSAQSLISSKNARQRANYSHGFSRDTIEVKIADTSDVSVSNNQFTGNVTEVNQLKTKLRGVKKAQKLFRGADANHRSFKERAARTTGKNIPETDKYITVTVPETDDIGTVAKDLESLDFIESATPKMLPTPAPSADYSGLQTYLTADRGINSVFANNFAGGKGENVTIVDLEYSWNVNHEDLSTLDNSDKKFVGNYFDPFTDTNHGTAVASVLVADHNGSGVNGIAPKADLKLVNTYSTTYGWDIANSIYSSLSFLKPGDIMLIEQQAVGRSGDPYGGFVPVEITPSVYDAIVTATAMGVTVIEPAGNGNQNLSDTAVYGSTFPDGKPNSGAIIVGAADSCSSWKPNAKQYSSSYGSRVNVYADGDCVAAAGFGTIQSGVNRDYTGYFNGTSSASAIVAGAAALVSSMAEAGGKTLTPLQLRAALTTTGLPQDTPTSTYIGRKPQIRQAVFSKVNVGLTSCYANNEWFAVNVSRNYFKNPTIEDAQKFAVSTIANAYKDKPGTQPVSFATNGPWCRTSTYTASEFAQLEQLSNYLELDYQSTQSYSGALLGMLLIYFGLIK